MKNVITILISLGAVVLFPQVTLGQTDTTAQAKPTAQTAKTQAAEVKAQVAEALYSRNHAGNHYIGRSKNDPGNISLNGKRYKKVGHTLWTSATTHDKNGEKVGVNKYIGVNTFVNGKDTIQVSKQEALSKGESYEYDDLCVKPQGDTKMTTRINYGNGQRNMKAFESKDGNSYYVSKTAKDPKTGEIYKIVVKRNTTDPQSRKDIKGGTYQSVSHTDIRGTFGPSFKSGYNILGPETSYK